jgi:hypothetical protein
VGDVRTYPAEQVEPVRDGEARAILTSSGLPSGRPTPFRPADVPRSLEVDPRYLVIGGWGGGGILIAVDTVDGRVVGYTPWHPEIYQVSTTLRRFVDSLTAIEALSPLAEDNPRHGSLAAAGEHVMAALVRIDPEELADPDSFWLDLVDDIKNGSYT